MDLRFYRTGTIAKAPIHPQDIDDIVGAARSACSRPRFTWPANCPIRTARTGCVPRPIFEAVRQVRAKGQHVRGLALSRGLGGMGAARDRAGGAASARTIWSARSRRSSATSRRRTGPCSPAARDRREFWQRAEDRNRDTAKVYDTLGLPEFYALEAFVQWRDH